MHPVRVSNGVAQLIAGGREGGEMIGQGWGGWEEGEREGGRKRGREGEREGGREGGMCMYNLHIYVISVQDVCQ